jgi:apolipoprotein N-acyltransferase
VRSGARWPATFALGYAFGLAFFAIGVHWIALLSDVALSIPWIKYPAWLLATGYLALFPATAVALAGGLARHGAASLAVTFPVAYLVVEEWRASGEMGFPWFQPGYSQREFLPLIQMASLGSVSLVTLWVLVLNVLVWRALSARGEPAHGVAARRGFPVIEVAAAALALLLPLAWGSQVLRSAPPPSRHVVALAQGNIAGEIKWAGTHQAAILDTFLGLSARAAATRPKPFLVIWPETATGSYLRKQLDQTLAVTRFANALDLPVFSGFADYHFDDLGQAVSQNAAGLFRPDGASGEVYAKRHLVPFGERIPFQSLMPALGRMNFGQAEWDAGLKPVLFPSPAGPYSCLICFEAIFPSLARDDVNLGARWLVNITNDEWFGNGAALHQHAAMAAFRTVENHVPMARCANTGLTVLIDAYGRVVGRLPVFVADVLVGALPSPGPRTWFSRLGDWPGLLAWGALAVLAWRIRRALTLPRGAR